MENALKTEESKILVRALETEKADLDQEEELTFTREDFQNQKHLLQCEKENVINENKVRLENQLQVLQLKQDALAMEMAEADSILKMQGNYRDELFSFAVSQTESFRPVLEEYNKKSDAVYARVLESLKEIIAAFQKNLLLLLETVLSEKKEANDRLKSLLLIAGIEYAPYSDFSYQDILLQITKATEIQHRRQKQRFNEFKNMIAGIIDNILKQIDFLASNYVNYMHSVRSEDQSYLNEIVKILNDGKQGQKVFDEANCSKTISKESEAISVLQKQKHLLNKEAKQNELRIINEFNRKEQKMKADGNRYEAEQKLRKKQFEDEDREFVHICKQKMQDLKKHYSENIVRSEKELYYIYQDEQEKNKEECRAKIHEL